MPGKQHDERKQRRFYEIDAPQISLIKESGSGSKTIPALMTNESPVSVACVYVGSPQFSPGDKVIWQEFEDHPTEGTVVRCREVENRVQFMVFKLN